MSARAEQLAAPTPAARTEGDLRAAARKVAAVGLFGVLPVAIVLVVVAVTFGRTTFLYDFHGGLYTAGHDILHGHSPFRTAYVARQAAILRRGGTPAMIDVAVYPPPVLLAVAPLSLLAYKLAALVFTGLSLGALGLALRWLGVRDWRCYGAALLSWPVLSGIILGALNPWLLLAIAAAWRHRDRVAVCGSSIGAAVVAKIFPWTLSCWLLITRRYRALAMGVGVGVVGLAATWAVIDFHGLTAYPGMLSNLSVLQRGIGVSPVAGLLSLGAPASVAQVGALAITGMLLAAARRVVRHPGGDARALGLALIAALTASPNVWPHYLSLLLVPIALLSPGFSALWLLPLLTDLAPVDQIHHRPALLLPYYAVEALLAVRLYTGRPLAALLSRSAAAEPGGSVVPERIGRGDEAGGQFAHPDPALADVVTR